MRRSVPVRPRLADVAERAGVSKKTVSNVINDFPFVAEATRAKVQLAIEELGYQPNVSARNLARGRTGLVALVIPRLDLPYFSELARHVVDVARNHSTAVVIEQVAGDKAAERRIVNGELSRRIDGMVYSPWATTAADLRRRTDTTPMVLIGEAIYDGHYDHVSIDNVASGRTATEHLLQLGRRRIAVIGTQRRNSRGAARERYDGYRQAHIDAGLEFDPELVRSAPRYDGEAGEAAMDSLLDVDPRPDAVFCFADLLALGAIRAIHRRGLRVPDDIAVVGHDDLAFGRVASPALTTIAPDKRQIAERALDLLERRIVSRSAPDPHGVEVGYTLQVRESSGG